MSWLEFFVLALQVHYNLNLDSVNRVLKGVIIYLFLTSSIFYFSSILKCQCVRFIAIVRFQKGLVRVILCMKTECLNKPSR